MKFENLLSAFEAEIWAIQREKLSFLSDIVVARAFDEEWIDFYPRDGKSGGAFCAGVAGVLSLTTSKSGALIGVLISLTTIPAAANVGVAAAYADWDSLVGSVEQLGLNLGAVLLAGTLTLTLQLRSYRHRRDHHRSDLGLPQHTRRRAATGAQHPRS